MYSTGYGLDSERLSFQQTDSMMLIHKAAT